jgi:hypothetical protein
MRTAEEIEEMVRLAWHAEREGRAGMRDALMTLVVAEGSVDGAVPAERFRRRLIAGRPDHWLASFPTVGRALGDSRVVAAVDRLRSTFPPIRVRRILLRGDAACGPYRGQHRPLSRIIDDLIGRPAVAEAPAAPSLPFPEPVAGATPAGRDAATALAYYLGVLLAIAILLASVLPQSQTPAPEGTRAA